MKKILVSCLLCLSISAFSQFKLGARIGYSLSNLSTSSDNIYTQNNKSTSNVEAGLSGEYLIDKNISIVGEINYSPRGGKREGMQPVVLNDVSPEFLGAINAYRQIVGLNPVSNADPLYANYTSETKLSYLQIPLMGRIRWEKKWGFFVQGGFFTAFMLGAKQKTSGNTNIYLNNSTPFPLVDPQMNTPLSFDVTADTNIKDDVHSVDFGIIGGLGVSRKINDKNELYFDARANYGFSKLQKDSTYGESHVGAIILSLGYNYIF